MVVAEMVHQVVKAEMVSGIGVEMMEPSCVPGIVNARRACAREL